MNKKCDEAVVYRLRGGTQSLVLGGTDRDDDVAVLNSSPARNLRKRLFVNLIVYVRDYSNHGYRMRGGGTKFTRPVYRKKKNRTIS